MGTHVDARHKRKYPEGERKETTAVWKQRVKDRLAENKRNGVKPRNQAELAKLLKVDKSSITKLWAAQTSALVVPISELLDIDLPMTPNGDDPLVRRVRRMDEGDRAKLRRLLDDFFPE